MSPGGWCWEHSSYLKEDGEEKDKEDEVNKGRQRVGGTRRSPTRLSSLVKSIPLLKSHLAKMCKCN